ncbi:alpha/beta hydrolase-fold protein [Corynebacterium terpenotabidum]|uniref:Trehalose corynomycolyl transferase n=1 Tax=Corynebacterium terpenotabidum Y-11 TaxID=1200352 RepID=S4XMK9_9CORY|nr:alpha/beta hydrolase-fold protein [Corynebacterium terpenotabidum]AGP31898.1 trehalose corynomycolyl transferase [Corynebacterium terpenotabidum Y-11]
MTHQRSYVGRHRRPDVRRTRAAGLAAATAVAASLTVIPVVVPVAAADTAGCSAINDGAYQCTVYSAAMNRDIPVIVRPALTAGNNKVAQFIDGADSTDVNAWTTAGGALQELANEDATLVFPAMDRFTWVQDWAGDEAKQFETFMAEELPQYLEDTWSVPNGGRGTTGVTGLSSGAYGAMNLAANHPDLYSSVYALSGLYDPGMPVQRMVIDGTSMFNNDFEGIPWSDEGDRAENNPTLNISNLTMPVIVSASSGIPNFAGDMGPDPIATVVKGGPFETGSLVFTAEFQARAALAGRTNIEFKYDLIGAHAWDTWRHSAFEQGNMHQFIANIGGGVT